MQTVFLLLFFTVLVSAADPSWCYDVYARNTMKMVCNLSTTELSLTCPQMTGDWVNDDLTNAVVNNGVSSRVCPIQNKPSCNPGYCSIVVALSGLNIATSRGSSVTQPCTMSSNTCSCPQPHYYTTISMDIFPYRRAVFVFSAVATKAVSSVVTGKDLDILYQIFVFNPKLGDIRNLILQSALTTYDEGVRLIIDATNIISNLFPNELSIVRIMPLSKRILLTVSLLTGETTATFDVGNDKFDLRRSIGELDTFFTAAFDYVVEDDAMSQLTNYVNIMRTILLPQQVYIAFPTTDITATMKTLNARLALVQSTVDPLTGQLMFLLAAGNTAVSGIAKSVLGDIAQPLYQVAVELDFSVATKIVGAYRGDFGKLLQKLLDLAKSLGEALAKPIQRLYANATKKVQKWINRAQQIKAVLPGLMIEAVRRAIKNPRSILGFVRAILARFSFTCRRKTSHSMHQEQIIESQRHPDFWEEETAWNCIIDHDKVQQNDPYFVMKSLHQQQLFAQSITNAGYGPW